MSRSQFPCDIRAGGCINVLGSPVGSPTACSAALQAKLKSAQELWDALTELADPHMAYHILRHCAGVCRLMYLFRCTPPPYTTPCAKQFDTAMRRVFQQIHSPLTSLSWLQATVPLRASGLGLTPAWPTNINRLYGIPHLAQQYNQEHPWLSLPPHRSPPCSLLRPPRRHT